MLNTERIHIMTKLNRYEEGVEKEYFRINEMYRSDYIGMALLKNFCFVTIGYIVILIVCGLYHLDYLLGQWFKMDLTGLAEQLIVGYLIVLVVYSLLVYLVCTVRYARMKKYIKAYDAELKKLEEQYSQNDRRENG